MSERRIFCLWHKERTPSLQLFHDGYYCFSCGRNGPLSDLGGVDLPKIEPQEPEDLAARFEYIDSLPRKEIRGLEFPADDGGYYLVWPNKDYYKYRKYGGSPKYISARGHKKPWFVANQGTSGACILIEGEINALSVAKACPEHTVISPGSASDFSTRAVEKQLPNLVQFGIIIVIADRDGPGAKAVMDAMAALRGKVAQLKWKLMSSDANEILCGGSGIERLREEIREGLGSEVA